MRHGHRGRVEPAYPRSLVEIADDAAAASATLSSVINARRGGSPLVGTLMVGRASRLRSARETSGRYGATDEETRTDDEEGNGVGERRSERDLPPTMFRVARATRRCQNKTANERGPRRRSPPPFFFPLGSLRPRLLLRRPLSCTFSSYRPTTVPITAILARHPAHDGVVATSLTLAGQTGGPRAPRSSPELDRRRCFSNDRLLRPPSPTLSRSLERVHDLLRRHGTVTSYPARRSRARIRALVSRRCV